MDRSLFPNSVIVTQVDLKRTETTKAEQIMQNRVDFTSRGIESGGEITVNLTNTDRINVAAFTGYTPRGDYIVGNVATSNIPMSDSSNGTVNVICAVYDETLTKSKPHESNGNTYPTAAEASFRIVVYTQTEFDTPSTLAPTDSNLSNDAVDRCLIIGKVTANGAGTALTTASIVDPTTYNSVLYATPSAPTSMAGVDISYVFPDTATGVGTLEFQYVTPNYQLRWTPFGGTAGSWVSWTVDATQTLQDGAAADSIRVTMAVSQMGTTSTSESITIVNLYGQTIPRLTGEDTLHRNKLGTGIVSPTNCHGYSLDDISGESISLLDEHQDVMHCNGIWKGSLPTCLGTYNSPTAGFDTLGVNPPSGNDLYYVNGKKLSELDTTSIVYNTLSNTSHLTEVYVTDEATLHMALKASYPALPRLLRGTWIINMSDSYPAGNYDLVLTVSGVAPALVYTLNWDDGAASVLNQGDDDQAVRLFSQDGVNWIDLWVRCSVTGANDSFLQTATATYTDSITVAASVTWDDNMHIANVPYWYDATIPKGRLGYPPYPTGSVTNVDKRSWGNLCKDNFNDDALRDLIYNPNDEYEYSGVVLYRDVRDANISTNFNITTSGASLDIYVSGGSYYCRGQRFDAAVAPTHTLMASKTHLVYGDDSGTLTSLNVTDSFAGVKQDAIRSLLGDGSYRLNDADTLHGTLDDHASPERGVPLYFVVTDGTGVTSTQNVMRNINNVADYWSVGRARGAAFYSLEAAMYYANCFTSSSDAYLDITIVASSLITEAFTQPSNVRVRGIARIGNLVTNQVSSASGAWKLSPRSIVEGVGAVTGGSGTYLFGLNTGVRIEGCTLSAFYGTYLFGDNAIATINDVVFKNNIVDAEGLTALADFGGTTFSNWLIADNTFTTSNTAPGGCLQEAFNNSIIAGNIITTDNTTQFKPAIQQTATTNCMIKDNLIYVGEGPQSAVEVGIQLAGGTNAKVLNNTITRAPGSASKATAGIRLLGSIENMEIAGNTFHDLNIGVYSMGYEGTNSIIDGNLFKDLETSAISVVFDGNFENFKVSNNSILTVNENGSTLAGMDDITAISIDNSAGTSFKNIVIENNLIRELDSSEASETLYGIKVITSSTPTSIDNLCILNNTLEDLTYVGGFAGTPCSGIYVNVNAIGTMNFEVNHNTIRNLGSTLSFLCGIFTDVGGAASYINCSCKGNNLADIALGNTSAYNSTNYGFQHMVTAASGKVELLSTGNRFHGTSAYPQSASTNYIPKILYVDTAFSTSKVENNYITVVPNNTSDYFSAHGIWLEAPVATLNPQVTNNHVDIPYGFGVRSEDSAAPRSLLISGNSIYSQYIGISTNGSANIVDNKIILTTKGFTNYVPFGAAAVSVYCYDWLNLSRNYTSVESAVALIRDIAGATNHPPDATWKAYHYYVTLNDTGGVTANRSYSFNVDSNYIDMKSEGGTPTLNGLYFVIGSISTAPSASFGQNVRITNNTFAGGPINPSGTPTVIPNANTGDEPYSLWCPDSGKGGGSRFYWIGGNSSSPTYVDASSIPSNLGIEQTDYRSIGTNYDSEYVGGPLLTGGDSSTW